jgi:CMP-N,N'-diacetyllegionaminic acid synthase
VETPKNLTGPDLLAALTQVECLAIIPARSGSKGLSDKNIRQIAGKPLMAWSIEHAIDSEQITRVIVSTDSEQYAQIARDYGAEVPFIRPSEISGDHATDLDVFSHALKWLQENENYVPDICVHLRPTCPVREPVVIDSIVNILLSKPELDSVRTVTPVFHPPYKMWTRGEDGYLSPVVSVPGIKEAWNEPRQKLPVAYIQTASIDAVRTRVIVENQSMTGSRIYGYVETDFYDIDTLEELEKAENKLAERKECPPAPSRSKTICCDIDGVIAAIVTDNDYNQSFPREEIICQIRELHRQGHRIILFTARGTMTGIDWRTLTEKQMKKWGVPYDELHFGKPAADYYVDDRALRDNELDQIK